MNDSDISKRLRYEPDTGNLIWLETGVKRWDSRYAGSVAGCAFQGTKCKKAYIVIKFNDSKTKLAHQVAFFLMSGRWPSGVDHVNGNGCDNRWDNLREATKQQNNRNRRLGDKSSTGLHGVYLRNGRYRVTVKDGAKSKGLGTFDTVFEAACRRKSFEVLSGYSEGHGDKRSCYGLVDAIESTNLGLRIK